MVVGQNETTRGPQVLVHVPVARVPFWVPVFDPQPHAKRSFEHRQEGGQIKGVTLVKVRVASVRSFSIVL